MLHRFVLVFAFVKIRHYKSKFHGSLRRGKMKTKMLNITYKQYIATILYSTWTTLVNVLKCPLHQSGPLEPLDIEDEDLSSAKSVSSSFQKIEKPNICHHATSNTLLELLWFTTKLLSNSTAY